MIATSVSGRDARNMAVHPPYPPPPLLLAEVTVFAGGMAGQLLNLSELSNVEWGGSG